MTTPHTTHHDDCGCSYRVEYSDGVEMDSNYETLRGPDFACTLTEPEDRTWTRDLEPVVSQLNAYEQEAVELKARAEKAEADLTHMTGTASRALSDLRGATQVVEDLRSELVAMRRDLDDWRSRFKALTGWASPDAAGNEVITLRRERDEAQQQLADGESAHQRALVHLATVAFEGHRGLLDRLAGADKLLHLARHFAFRAESPGPQLAARIDEFRATLDLSSPGSTPGAAPGSSPPTSAPSPSPSCQRPNDHEWCEVETVEWHCTKCSCVRFTDPKSER